MVEGLHFLSMEYIDGEDLASLLRRIGRLPQDKAMEFTRKICAGLGAAHERGVLHRDLKPANVMIDGRGQPRITDFGLAGLAAEIPLSDLRSGTPAYLSPEQKAGKEVTTRSDLYSLGLVLHEMFTGKARKDSHSAPSEIVKDLDPAIERVILRCLEEEPKRRPATALSVALGMPGADPIAAALAAGETPSPEMVAASQEREGFQPRTAVLWFLVCALSLGGGLFLSGKLGFLSQAPLPKPPDALAEISQQVLQRAGYTKAPADSAYGFSCCDNVIEADIRKLPPDRQAAIIASHRPALIHFWYRQHGDAFGAGEGRYERPTETSPANSELGMMRVDLDATGRLLRLEVQPWDTSAVAGEVNWGNLFEAAGLNLAAFAVVKDDVVPPMAADSQIAWRGSYSEVWGQPVTIHGASWRGRPVFFEVQKIRAASPLL
jgi:serine/threonine-protein kinase